MRVFLLFAGAVIGLSSLSAEAQAACNARGEFCTYPTWAANSFATQGGERPRGYLAPDVTAYGYGPAYGYAPTYSSAPAYGYGPAYSYAPAYRYGRVYGYGAAYGSVTGMRIDERYRRDWR